MNADLHINQYYTRCVFHVHTNVQFIDVQDISFFILYSLSLEYDFIYNNRQ